MRYRIGVVGASILLGLTAPATGQLGNSSYQFLQAVEQRDGAKATALLNMQGSTVLNARGDDGAGGLHIVTRRRDGDWLRFLLGKRADVNLQDRAGDTPLHIAARGGWMEGMDLLLTRARVDVPNRQGETPLIVAVQQRQAAAVRRLVEAGANPDRTDNASGRSARDYAKLDRRSTEILRLIEQARPKAAKPVAGPKL